MIMNPDVILEPRCLCRLIAAISAQDIGIVEARQTLLSMQRNIMKKLERQNGPLLLVL